MNEFTNSGIILNKGQVKGEGVWSRSRERGCGVFFEGSTWFSGENSVEISCYQQSINGRP